MAEKLAASVSPQLERCAYFVERKRRFCKMVPARGKRFCGEHGALEEENNRKRIQCPLDSKHTVYEDQLQKHLRKCNSREKPKPVYFARDINAGLKEATGLPEEKQVPIFALSKEELEDLIRKLRKASNGNMERLNLLGPRRCFVEFGAGRGKLSHWVDIALQDAKDVHFLLVERATTRFKVDGKHRKNGFERLQVDIQHLCLNKVPVLVKEKLPAVGIGKHVCGSATDLALRCLVETYANLSDDDRRGGPEAKRLKIERTSRIPTNSPSETCSDSVAENWSPVAGIVIALCCHHRCDWKHYVGREFFTTVGLGVTEFNYFKRMTSWATCGMRERSPLTSTIETESEEHEPHDRSVECSSDSLQGLLTTEERKQIGRLCKLLLDHGRIEYLQQRGYDAVLQYYTDLDVSLENVLLTAVPHQSSLSHSDS
ncbi:tRNA:m(4)X modification enzyme TRM13 homolog isoform X4 [Eublepharis macularius]|uniref:tRNA:m(4)X modification enzyme TRM13 n=1 Tax=Eublepharis macularius TaxID=481883 RepID=A0AA97JD08_EUBMA|nr:tRNA:m(4)X modification enzyme TRM13 homolog isoform X4 [Eublepharis macularius]